MTTTPRLTDREHQALRAIAQGLTNAQIGRALNLSRDTAKLYVSRLYRRIGARDRAHAVALGFKLGLLTVDDVGAPTGRRAA